PDPVGMFQRPQVLRLACDAPINAHSILPAAFGCPLHPEPYRHTTTGPTGFDSTKEAGEAPFWASARWLSGGLRAANDSRRKYGGVTRLVNQDRKPVPLRAGFS